VGVCFGCQIFPELPQDAWDITMNEVIYSWPQRGQ
jgi:5-formyltetrahydrofolate cyclo-ligase